MQRRACGGAGLPAKSRTRRVRTGSIRPVADDPVSFSQYCAAQSIRTCSVQAGHDFEKKHSPAGSIPVPVLRMSREFDRGSCAAAVKKWTGYLGKSCNGLHPVQQQKGGSYARRGRHAADSQAVPAQSRDVHSRLYRDIARGMETVSFPEIVKDTLTKTASLSASRSQRPEFAYFPLIPMIKS